MKISLARRLSLLVGAAAFATLATAQPYPDKPIRLVVPFAPGGSPTLAGRLVGDGIAERLKQPVVLDHRPGGNTIIGTEAVAKSPPDGYTLLFASSSLVTTPLLMPAPFDPIKDFTPVAGVVSGELLLTTHPSVQANDIKSFIALAKANPGKLNHGSLGVGSVSHLASEQFNILTGIKVTNIPYKGSGPVITDLVGGQLQIAFLTPATALQYVTSARVKALAVSGSQRFSGLPNVPTFAESGVPDFDARFWFGVVAPAGTPRPIVDRLAKEIAEIVADAKFKEAMAKVGLDIFYQAPDAFAALVRNDVVKYRKIISTAGIKIEN
jgi:tripartite-type tricarboxylate transporter receptor subunit TctC